MPIAKVREILRVDHRFRNVGQVRCKACCDKVVGELPWPLFAAKSLRDKQKVVAYVLMEGAQLVLSCFSSGGSNPAERGAVARVKGVVERQDRLNNVALLVNLTPEVSSGHEDSTHHCRQPQLPQILLNTASAGHLFRSLASSRWNKCSPASRRTDKRP